MFNCNIMQQIKNFIDTGKNVNFKFLTRDAFCFHTFFEKS